MVIKATPTAATDAMVFICSSILHSIVYIYVVRVLSFLPCLLIILDIDECTLQDKYFGDCQNLLGGYSCQCPKGTTGNPYTPNGCVKTNTGKSSFLIHLVKMTFLDNRKSGFSFF